MLLHVPPPPPPMRETQCPYRTKTNNRGLKQALHSLNDHCEWSQYQGNIFRNFNV